MIFFIWQVFKESMASSSQGPKTHTSPAWLYDTRGVPPPDQFETLKLREDQGGERKELERMGNQPV